MTSKPKSEEFSQNSLQSLARSAEVTTCQAITTIRPAREPLCVSVANELSDYAIQFLRISLYRLRSREPVSS